MKSSQKCQLLNSLNLTLGLYPKVKLTFFLLPELHMWQVTKKMLSIQQNQKPESAKYNSQKEFLQTNKHFPA